MQIANIQEVMSWQDHLNDDERAELAAVEAAFTKAQEALDPIKAKRNAVRRKLKIRCDARMLRAKPDDGPRVQTIRKGE